MTRQRIRSFIRRQGRITPGQEQAIQQFWPKFGLEASQTYDYRKEFNRSAPLIMEIGFGNGESLAEMASANADNNYLGIEVHKPGVGHLLSLLENGNIGNVRIYCHDAIEVLENHIIDSGLTGLHLFFPDPWPKKRHHKRRIVRPEFIDLVAKKLKPGGYFHAATDWQNYAEQMLDLFKQQNTLTNVSLDDRFCERPQYRPITKFERRGVDLGYDVWDLIFKKV